MEWARHAATKRVLELQAELAEIHKVFPDLLGEPAEAPAAAPRTRRKMSREARKKISDAQKRRWSKVRAKKKR
jgi:hypothetical protein